MKTLRLCNPVINPDGFYSPGFHLPNIQTTMQKTIFLLLTLITIGKSPLEAQKIYDVYTAGGISGGTYIADYVILTGFAPNENTMGKSLQYRSSGTNWQVVSLSGSADAQGIYRIWLSASTSGAPWTPQLTGNFIIMTNTSSAQLALMNTTTAITPSTCPSGGDLLDLVGYIGSTSGSQSTCSETSSAPATSADGTQTRRRKGALPGQDTGNNSVDFEVILASTPILPVELLYFDAQKHTDKIELTWATAIEKDNAYFSVERSADGLTYQTVGKVDGFGNSVERRNYSFIDERPLSGLAYYRLRQVDQDGAFEFSPVVSVLNRNERVLGVYPNPGKEWFTLSGLSPDMPLQVRVFDLMGRVVYEQNSVEGSNTLRLDLINLEKGTYLIQVSGDEGYLQQLRIVKE